MIDDVTNDDVTSSNARPQWVLQEWEPRERDSPRSPTYNCDRGMAAVSAPSSPGDISVGSPFYYIGSPIYIPGSPIYIPGSPLYSPMSPESSYGGHVNED